MAQPTLTFAQRLDQGAPLRVGEMSKYIGYGCDQIRKWMAAGTIGYVCAPGTTERRIPVLEARRIAGILQIPGVTPVTHDTADS